MTSDIDALADPESAMLGRPGMPDGLPVPDETQVVAEHLVFDFGSDIHGRDVPTDLLDRFVSAITDAGLVRFARRFGPLALFPEGEGDFVKPDPSRLAGYYEEHRERLASWRKFQHQVRLVLGLAAAFHSEDVPSFEALRECEALGLFRPGTVDAACHKGAASQRNLGINAALTCSRVLAEACGLRPALALYGRSGISLVFQDAIAVWPFAGLGLSLAGALTVQLMAAIAGSGFALCSSCGEPFVPKRRKPAFGKRRYCSRCGRAAAVRDAKRDHRAKLLRAREE